MTTSLIDLKPDQLQKLGTRLQAWIQAGLDQKGGAPSWWAEVERFYRNEMPEKPAKGLAAMHVPFSQPRQDMLKAQVCTVVGKQEPIMLCDIEDNGLATRRQMLIHKMWTQAGFDIQIRKAATQCGNINKSFYRLTPKGVEDQTYGGQSASSALDRPGVNIDVIHPEDIAVYPAALGGVKDAALIGHRFYRRLKTIKDLMAVKHYYVGDPVAGDSPDEHDETGAFKRAASSLASAGPEMDHELVELWDAIVKLDIEDFDPKLKGERMYRVTIAVKTAEILALEEYPYARPWYFESFYIEEDRVYWGPRSVGRNLKALQDAYNKLHAMLYSSGMTMAKPPIVGPKLAEKYSKWEAGDYIESDEPVQPWSPTINVDLQPVLEQIIQLERVGDQVARVSQNTLGSAQGKADTATENSIIAAGVAVGLEEYIVNFCTPFPAMAEFTEKILLGMWEDVAPLFMQPGPPDETGAPTQVPLVTPEEMQVPTVWSTNGMSPNATPQARFAAVAQFVQMSADPSYGLDKYELGSVALANSALAGVGNIQISRDELQQQMMAAQQQQMQQQEAEANAKQSGGPGPDIESIKAMVEQLVPPVLAKLLHEAAGGGHEALPQDGP